MAAKYRKDPNICYPLKTSMAKFNQYLLFSGTVNVKPQKWNLFTFLYKKVVDAPQDFNVQKHHPFRESDGRHDYEAYQGNRFFTIHDINHSLVFWLKIRAQIAAIRLGLPVFMTSAHTFEDTFFTCWCEAVRKWAFIPTYWMKRWPLPMIRRHKVS